MSNENAETSSEVLMREVHKLSNAGGSLIQIRTREPLRAATILRNHFIMADPESPYREWDSVNGFRSFTRENLLDHLTKGNPSPEDFFSALEDPLKQLRTETSEVKAKSNVIHYFVYMNAHAYAENNPVITELLQQYAAILPATNVCMLLITPDVTIRSVENGTILVTDLPTPTAAELEATLRQSIKDAVEGDQANYPGGSELEDADYRRISHLGLGMTLYEFETYATIAMVEASDRGEESITPDAITQGINKGKTEVVKQSDILELIPTEGMNVVGGMQRLKDWIDERSGCFTDEAKEFGIEPPKGFAAVGVPGTGKSLMAKATGASMEIPVVRLDFGRVFSKYVGDSESRVRSALRMVEAMAPCVLFVDEIDKGLGGAAGGGGDSGTSSRVLGSFLTWLQECKAPVFTIVTANHIDGLPPELLRRGRFDGIFSVGLPTVEERREVLEIHLRKRGKDIAELGELREFDAASNNYVPAEIESAVKDALISAFNRKEEVTEAHIVTALRNMVPMSTSHKATIDRMLEWAEHNATPVNYKPGDSRVNGPAKTTTTAGRTIVRAPARRAPRRR